MMKMPLPARVGVCLCLLLLAPTLTASAQDGALEKVTVRAVARFGFDRATVRDEDRATLLAEVTQLRDVTWQNVTAVGHTDSKGTEAYNLQLAQRRAEAVRTWLLEQGLEPAMVRTNALGSRSPVADNANAAGRAMNRRTEVQFEGVRPSRR